MSKKDLRKKLELELVKVIENNLNKSNEEATKKIRKTTYEAAKTIAKKFYKTIKTGKDKQTTNIVLKKATSAPAKKTIKKVVKKVNKQPAIKVEVKK